MKFRNYVICVLLLGIYSLPLYAAVSDFYVTRSDVIYDTTQSGFPSVVLAANGDLVCSINNPPPDATNGDVYPGTKLLFVRSNDQGQTWSQPYLTMESKHGDSGALFGYLFTATDGKIVLALSDVRSVGQLYQYLSDVEIYVSTDNGMTFSETPVVVPTLEEELEPVSAGIMIADNGDWLLPGYLINRLTTPRVVCGFWRSMDEGANWGTLERAFADAPPGDPDYKAFNETDIVLRSDGSLLAVARTDRVSSGFPYANGQLYYTESFDNGYTWTSPQLMGIPGHSPALLRLPSGEIMLGCRRLSGSGNKTSVYISSDGVNFTYAFDGVNPRPNANSATGYPTFALLNNGDIYMAYYAADTVNLPWPMHVYCAGNLIHWDFSCGARGHLKADLNLDCQVDFLDFVFLAENWLLSTNPTTPGFIDCSGTTNPRCKD